MSYIPGQTVKVVTSAGLTTSGTVMYATDWGNGYWVKYINFNDKEDSDVFSAQQLDSWNSNERNCTCGAESVKHPGHSHWCDKVREPELNLELW